jgi:hypothetical protein
MQSRRIQKQNLKENANLGLRRSYKYPIFSRTNGSRRHPSYLCTRSSSKSGSAQPSRSTPVAIIQFARRCSHLDFPRSCPTEVGRFIIIPSSSGRSQLSFRACSSFGCGHLRKMYVRDILNLLHHQHLSDISSSLFYFRIFRHSVVLGYPFF